MAVICSDFKWLSFRISDPIWNQDHLQPNLFSTFQNPHLSGFQIPTVFDQKMSDNQIILSSDHDTVHLNNWTFERQTT